MESVNDTSDLKLHLKKLEKYCRVCAKVLQAKETAHLCHENTELLKTFNIDTTTDQKHVHPKAYCHKCHTIANKISNGAVVETAVVPVDWESHGTDCWVCKGKAGRPKKATKKRGRPKVDSGKGIANTVLKTAPTSWQAVQPLYLSRFLPPASSLSLHDLQCKLCDCIVDRPVKTPCNNLVCAKCISSLVLNAESSLQCPCCEERHDLSPTLFVPASDVVLKVLGALLICCDKSSCTVVMSLKHLAEHVKSGCEAHTTSFSPSKLTMKQILSRPLQSPPTVVEQKAAANIVKRLLHTSPPATSSSSESATPAPVVKLTTDGTVSTQTYLM